jgi:hypothetical protein
MMIHTSSSASGGLGAELNAEPWSMCLFRLVGPGVDGFGMSEAGYRHRWPGLFMENARVSEQVDENRDEE